MNTLKKATFSTFMIALALMITVGGYNSSLLDKSAFFRNDFGIKFAKRLDEIKGEITIGRMAASVPSWKNSSKLIKKQAKQILKRQVTVKKATKKKEVAKDSAIPAPVVNDDLELSLSGGFYNKKALTEGSEFSGSAMVQDGVIEAINVSLPDGQSLTINTNERMVGNVFQYEDTGTRERRSGLFYKVKPGVFMVTLTDDSQFPGLRLEFRSNANIQNLADNLDTNNQNEQGEQLEKAQNEEDVEQDFYQEAAEQDEQQEDSASHKGSSFGFNFSV